MSKLTSHTSLHFFVLSFPRLLFPYVAPLVKLSSFHIGRNIRGFSLSESTASLAIQVKFWKKSMSKVILRLAWLYNYDYIIIINKIRPRLHGTGSLWSRIKLNGLKTSLALAFMTILQNLITTNHGRNGESKYDRKLTEFDLVTTWIWFRINGT